MKERGRRGQRDVMQQELHLPLLSLMLEEGGHKHRNLVASRSWEGFPDGLAVKNPPANAGDAGEPGSVPWSGRSPGGMVTHSSILAGESHGQRTLMGYSPLDLKESDMTEAIEHTEAGSILQFTTCK